MGIHERKIRERERRRQQILVAARKVISHKGMGDATIEEIAEEAEMSSGTIYYYFRSKEELFNSLSLRVLQYLNLRISAIVTRRPEAPLGEKLAEARQAVLDTYQLDPQALRHLPLLLSASSNHRVSADFLNRMQTVFAELTAQLTQLFGESRKNGGTDPFPGEAMADLFLALLSGIFIWADIRIRLTNKPVAEPFSPTLDMGIELFNKGLQRDH